MVYKNKKNINIFRNRRAHIYETLLEIKADWFICIFICERIYIYIYIVLISLLLVVFSMSSNDIVSLSLVSVSFLDFFILSLIKIWIAFLLFMKYRQIVNLHYPIMAWNQSD